jgi:hypothetical protein
VGQGEGGVKCDGKNISDILSGKDFYVKYSVGPSYSGLIEVFKVPKPILDEWKTVIKKEFQK